MDLEKPELIEKYQCPACMKLHDSSYSAENCCEPEMVYVCSVCGGEEATYDDKEEAAEHLAMPHDKIGVVDEEDITEKVYEELLLEGVPPLTARELAEKEAARLVPV